MAQFNSEREKYFWFTHLFLYLGLALPYLYYQNNPLKNIAVIITVGDAMAAIIGTKYGRTKFMGRSNKSVEGFLACVFAIVSLQYYFYSNVLTIEIMVISSIICGLVEVYAGDGDNFMVPFFYIISLEMAKNRI